ncbi:MAG: zinc ribbon domain-containing protein [Peptococcaceae bacterium]|nr:zinc ribbon domain-containing protein [Peptococcaceae bacterium]
MPNYDFSCNQCGQQFAVSCTINKKDQQICPQCGQDQLTQRFTAVNIGKNGCYRCEQPEYSEGRGVSGCYGCH